jgi:hypothetical protein
MRCHLGFVFVYPLFVAAKVIGQERLPDPVKNTGSEILLNLPKSGTDPVKIDYAKLPVLKGEHAVVGPFEEQWKLKLHNYLIHHDGRYWCMWSHGPIVEDVPTQHVRYATSQDGLKWSEAKVLVGVPKADYAYIARGFWLRDGELLALAAYYKGRGAFGVNKELELQAHAWDPKAEAWKFKGLVFKDAINNFAPQKIPTGEWLMTRRDARFNVSMLTGGLKAIDDWQVSPVVDRKAVDKFSPDEPFWWVLPDKNLVALFRDNGGSSRIFRSFSTDNGKSWSIPVKTNFPNSTSKFFALRTSGGYWAMVSNANPVAGRQQMFLSISEDGLVFSHMALLDIPSPRRATLQYPHVIEHDGHLLIAFSRNKNIIEVLKIPLQEVDALRDNEKKQ